MLLFGLFAGIIGIRVGRKAANNLTEKSPGTTNNSFLNQQKNPKHEFSYSLLWLFINFLLIIISFILLNYTSWITWSIAITAIVVIWAFRYKRALRQVSKPKFWIFFVLITLITAFVFTKAQPGDNVLQKGLLTGLQMNFRAVVIIVGFAVTGTELYNPVIRNYFLGTSFKHLPLAIELSVESLPFFIACIPDFKSIVKNPISVFSRFILHAESRLSEIREKAGFSQKVFIIGGSVSEGKTSFAKNLIEVFRKNNIPVGGFLSERVMADSRTIGYDLVDIETNATEILLRESDGNRAERIGRFAIYPKGFEMGVKILSPSRLIEKRIVIIDEVGTLELNNKGWSGCISDLVSASDNHILITVRDSLTEKVIQKWNFSRPFIYKVSETNYISCSKAIMEQINS